LSRFLDREFLALVLVMNPYWIQAVGIRLAIIPRPRGHDWLLDDITDIRRAGVDVVVSTLTPAETEELGLLEEAVCCTNNGVQFLSFPIEDRSVPMSLSELGVLLSSLEESLSKGKAVAVHCRAGVGRSAMLVALVLVQHGFSADSAFRAIEESRGCSVPDTPEQRQWVEDFASHLKPQHS
jgi:protein-tyrosine phosphatase